MWSFSLKSRLGFDEAPCLRLGIIGSYWLGARDVCSTTGHVDVELRAHYVADRVHTELALPGLRPSPTDSAYLGVRAYQPILARAKMRSTQEGESKGGTHAYSIVRVADLSF